MKFAAVALLVASTSASMNPLKDIEEKLIKPSLEKIEPYLPYHVMGDTPCCEVCPDDQIKTFSIDTKGGHCGESCIPPSKFWLYKIFEPGMQKADANDQKVCAENGWPTFYENETHGFPGLLTVSVDFYNQ